MLEFLINLLRAAPVVTALLVVASLNTNRQRRVRQTWVPLVAFVFAVVALILLYRFNDRFSDGLVTISDSVPLIPRLMSAGSLYVLENAVLLLGFAVVKLASKPVFTTLFAHNTVVAETLVARVYYYDADCQLWFVERRFAKTRDLYRALYWTSLALTILFVALALTFPAWPGFSAVAFPAVATMIIGEFYFAVDGLTREEYERQFYGEKDSARRVANFGPLRSIFRDRFPGRVLGEGVHLSSLAPLESGFRLGEMVRAQNADERLAGNYFERLRREGRDIDVNLAGASSTLMSGQNVLFANPFHQDLGPYLGLPMYRELLEGRRCLVIAGRDSRAADLERWIASALEDVTGIPGLWRVRRLDSVSREDFDVGILAFPDVHNLDVLVNNDDLLASVGLLVLAEPSLMLTTGQLGLEMIVERCNRNSPTTIAAFDGNHDGLVDTLSHLTKSSLTEVVASSLPQGASCEVIWRGDGPHMHSSILPGVSRFLGIGTEISAVAFKYQVDRVHWVGGNTFPVTDMKWIAEQYYAPINSFADLDMSQDALGERLAAVAHPWDLKKQDNYFMVVEDEVNNVYETVRQYATRACRAGFVNLVSSDYLLRDYMVANREVFATDPKAIPSVVPDYARTERNGVLRMLLCLRAFGMTESEIDRQLDLLNCPDDVDDPTQRTPNPIDWEPPALRRLRQAVHRSTQSWSLPLWKQGGQRLNPHVEEAEPRYHLELGSYLDDVIQALQPAYFFVEDDVDGVNVVGSMLLGHVYQAMLPGQFITYGGKYYEVQAIVGDTTRPRVVLRRAADHIQDRRVYRQRRRYQVSCLRDVGGAKPHKRVASMSMQRLSATVRVETLGYVESSARSDLARRRQADVSGVPPRHHVNKHVVRIHMPGSSADVRRTVAVLLNEVFVTTFPHAHEFVVALVPDDDGDVLLHPLTVERGVGAEQDILEESILLVEDSMVDLGLAIAIERNWERLLEIVTDYLDWNATPSPNPCAETGDEPQGGGTLFPERPAITVGRERSWLEHLVDRIRGMVVRDRRQGPSQPSGNKPPGAAADDSANADVSDARNASGDADSVQAPSAEARAQDEQIAEGGGDERAAE